LPLHIATTSGFGEAITLLLDHDPQPIEVRDRRGKSPLINAAQNLKEAAVWRLLSAGCDLNARDKHGQTAAHLAARPGGGSVYRLLERRGADLSIEDYYGRTPGYDWKLSHQRERVLLPEDHGRFYYPFLIPVDLDMFWVP
jgi:ankyrin repeat protein